MKLLALAFLALASCGVVANAQLSNFLSDEFIEGKFKKSNLTFFKLTSGPELTIEW